MKVSEYLMLFAKLEQAKEQIQNCKNELKQIRKEEMQYSDKFCSDFETWSYDQRIEGYGKLLTFGKSRKHLQRKIKSLENKIQKLEAQIISMKQNLSEDDWYLLNRISYKINHYE